MKTYGGVKLLIHVIITLELLVDARRWSASETFYSGKTS
jgi:hypothetical protein